ncbi:MAG: hypothetical protein IPL21_14355 [Saprospirales bacterium]|nr:hypothetical protein [Saprospirales bacterium]
MNIFVRNGTYKSKIISFNQLLRYYTIFPDSTTTYFPTENGTCDTIIFRLVPINNIQDLQAGIVPITIARPGFNQVICLF